jgi:hypothetical protein
LYGKTYGSTSKISNDGSYCKGMDQPASIKYRSTIQDNFTNQKELQKRVIAAAKAPPVVHHGNEVNHKITF